MTATAAHPVACVPGRVRLSYGPRRSPLESNVATTEQRWGYRPFHGIVSRSMRGDPAMSVVSWERTAPRLDDLRRRTGVAPDGVARAVLDAAERAGLLTYDASLAVAIATALALLDDCPEGRAVDVWNPKEGQTSSVWRIRVTDAGGRAVLDLAANVARDRAASADLSAIAEGLQAAEASGCVAVPVRLVEQDGVQVLLQPWLAGALEINPVAAPGGCLLAVVTEFVSDPQAPASITGRRGRWLSPGEHARLGSAAARVRAASPALAFSPQNGDWVLYDGKPVLVACDAATRRPQGEHQPTLDVLFGVNEPVAASALRSGAEGAER